MKTKLTLSLPEKTVLEAKRIAKIRRTSVSALFAASLEQWRGSPDVTAQTSALNTDSMADLVGALRPQSSFDTRSERIRRKHG
ncbi:MAG: DUF6364 family protein [Opitutales bacterium]